MSSRKIIYLVIAVLLVVVVANGAQNLTAGRSGMAGTVAGAGNGLLVLISGLCALAMSGQALFRAGGVGGAKTLVWGIMPLVAGIILILVAFGALSICGNSPGFVCN